MPSLALPVLLGVFLLSNLLFLLRATATPAIALGCSAGLVLPTVLLFRRVQQAPLGWRLGLGALALAPFVCVVGGSGHLMFTTEDWLVRDAVLHDLMRPVWPVTYQDGNALHVLRAPLGFYMIPAMIGYGWGAGAAQFAVLTQNAAILACVLLLFLREATTTRARLVVGAVFLLFAGWDAAFALMVVISSLAHGQPIDFGLHINHLNGLEYSSVITDVFWAPNHGLPAFAFAGVYLCWKRGECSAAAVALFAGLCLMWSPLAVMGATPFAAYALLADWRAGRLKLGELGLGALAGAAVVPGLIFLQLDGGHVVRGWMLGERGFWVQYPLFFAFDILPLLYLLARGLGGEGARFRPEAAIAGLMLVAIPFYRIGASNDFVMRASVVPLTLVAVIAARRLAGLLEERRWAQAMPMLIVLAVGAVTPGLEAARAFIHPASAPVDLPLPQAWARSPFDWQPRDTYYASSESLWRVRAVLKPAPASPRNLARAP